MRGIEGFTGYNSASVYASRNRNTGSRQYTYENGTVASNLSISKASNKKVKKLRYNFKAISSQLMRTTTSTGASKVAVKAREKVSQLRRKLFTGEYDDEELRNAIVHAEKIARIAKKRVKHLQEEERAKDTGGVCEDSTEELQQRTDEDDAQIMEDAGYVAEKMGLSSEEMQQLAEEMAQLQQEALDEMNEFTEEMIGGTSQEDLDPEDLELLKKKHRSKEWKEITDADMKYLRAVFEKLAKDKENGVSIIDGNNNNSNNTGVFLDLGGVPQPVQITEIPLSQGGNFDSAM